MEVDGELRLAKNAIWVQLTCPSSEVSPPCRGKIVVADPPLVFNGIRTLQARPLHAHFTVWPGRTKTVPVREPHPRGKRLPKERGEWKVVLLVFAKDGAGNEWKLFKRQMPLIRR